MWGNEKCNLHQLFHFVWQQVKKTGSIFYLLDGQISNRHGCPPEFPWFIKQSAYALPSVENMQVAYFSSLNFPFKLPLCLSICVFLLNHHSTDKKVMKVQIATIRVQGVTHQTEISGGFITSCVMILL